MSIKDLKPQKLTEKKVKELMREGEDLVSEMRDQRSYGFNHTPDDALEPLNEPTSDSEEQWRVFLHIPIRCDGSHALQLPWRNVPSFHGVFGGQCKVCEQRMALRVVHPFHHLPL